MNTCASWTARNANYVVPGGTFAYAVRRIGTANIGTTLAISGMCARFASASKWRNFVLLDGDYMAYQSRYGKHAGFKPRYGAWGYAAVGTNRYVHKTTYTRETWPPRGRGRGESLTSPRRIAAKQRAAKALQLRMDGYTWRMIAASLGYKCPSGAWRAVRRCVNRVDAYRYGKKHD